MCENNHGSLYSSIQEYTVGWIQHKNKYLVMDMVLLFVSFLNIFFTEIPYSICIDIAMGGWNREGYSAGKRHFLSWTFYMASALWNIQIYNLFLVWSEPSILNCHFIYCLYGRSVLAHLEAPQATRHLHHIFGIYIGINTAWCRRVR